MGITEQAGRRVAHQLLGNPVIGVGVIATRPELAPTEEACAAGDGERHHYPVSGLELVGADARSNFHHFAHELVAHDVALFHSGHKAVVQMQV